MYASYHSTRRCRYRFTDDSDDCDGSDDSGGSGDCDNRDDCNGSDDSDDSDDSDSSDVCDDGDDSKYTAVYYPGRLLRVDYIGSAATFG